MDVTALLGLILGIGGILLGNAVEGGQVNSLIQGAAAVIVLGGTFGAVLLSSRKEDLKSGFAMLGKVFQKDDNTEFRKSLAEIIDCAKIARRESILSLEARVPNIRDPFLSQVMRTVIDGIDPKIVRDVFEKKIDLEEQKLLSAAKIWSDAGGYAPTIGIIGAVLGLIQVMGNLTDTSKLGAGIAVAFVATIYGVGTANLIFIPISSRLKKKIVFEMKLKEMMLEGALAIQAGVTATLIELKLRTYLESEKT
jgi:chemotaxis protein MotA